MKVAWVLALCLSAGVAGAQAPVTSEAPQSRASSIASAVAEAMRRAPALPTGRTLVSVSPRPLARPDNLQRRNRVTASGLRVIQPAIFPRGKSTGGLCGLSDVDGERMQSVPGKIRGCGVAEPVRVRAISGVALSQPSVMDCTTLKALRQWMATGMTPAIGRLGGGVARIEIAAHYACRTRNNQKGAKISEHGKGRAIDISGFTLRNGTKITVLRGWRGEHGERLRRMHRAACGPFGTVLGPNANRFHADHFHFDTARYRSGSYCR